MCRVESFRHNNLRFIVRDFLFFVTKSSSRKVSFCSRRSINQSVHHCTKKHLVALFPLTWLHRCVFTKGHYDIFLEKVKAAKWLQRKKSLLFGYKLDIFSRMKHSNPTYSILFWGIFAVWVMGSCGNLSFICSDSGFPQHEPSQDCYVSLSPSCNVIMTNCQGNYTSPGITELKILRYF